MKVQTNGRTVSAIADVQAGGADHGVLSPRHRHLSTARQDTAAASIVVDVDDDVLRTYRAFVASGRAQAIHDTLVDSLKKGGKVFFTGCGSTGRLSIQLVSIWRDFWQQQKARGLRCTPSPEDFENRAFAVMAGGDFALIKAVEGFEDFTAFGKKQIGDLGVSAGDVVFAITEGGETSFVIGTAWRGVEAGAKVYFVYNNPDDVFAPRATKREVSRIQIERSTSPPARWLSGHAHAGDDHSVERAAHRARNGGAHTAARTGPRRPRGAARARERSGWVRGPSCNRICHAQIG